MIWHSINALLILYRHHLIFGGFDDGKEGVKVKVRECIRSDNPEMLGEDGKAWSGYCGYARWMVEEELKSNTLKLVLDQYQHAKLPMYMVYKDVEHQPQSIRSFIDFLSNYFYQNAK